MEAAKYGCTETVKVSEFADQVPVNRYTRDRNSSPHASLPTVTIDYALRGLQRRSRERRENSNGTHGQIRVYQLTGPVALRTPGFVTSCQI